MHFLLDKHTAAQKNNKKHIQDIYSICLELENFFIKETDGKLQVLLIDHLVELYLSAFHQTKAYLYAKEYVHKDFVRRNATQPKTKLKKTLFCFSPWLFGIVSRVFICLRKMLRRMKKVC